MDILKYDIRWNHSGVSSNYPKWVKFSCEEVNYVDSSVAVTSCHHSWWPSQVIFGSATDSTIHKTKKYGTIS